MELSAGTTRLTVDESAGARIAALEVAGADGSRLGLVGRYQDSPHGWGAFPMAPWAGRVRDARLTWRGTTHELPANKAPHAIHGTVARVAWDVVEQEAGRAVLRRDLGPDWPWAGHAVLRYDLDETALRIVLEVHAEDEEMPAWCGLHPWFPRELGGASALVDLRAGSVMGKDDADITTADLHPVPPGVPNEVQVDAVFADVAWPVVVRWPGVASLSVDADTRYGVVFTEREEAVCVEPQTAPPDATALGLEGVASPGSPVVMTSTWTWTTP